MADHGYITGTPDEDSDLADFVWCTPLINVTEDGTWTAAKAYLMSPDLGAVIRVYDASGNTLATSAELVGPASPGYVSAGISFSRTSGQQIRYAIIAEPGQRVGRFTGFTGEMQANDGGGVSYPTFPGDPFVQNYAQDGRLAVGGTYTAGGGGDPAPSITDVDSDESITSTQAGWEITGTDFDTATVEIRQGSTTVAQTVNSQNSTTINCDTVFDDGAGPHLKYGSATAAVINGDDQEDTIAISIAVPTGRAYVDIGTPNTTAANRITAVDDIATGDQLEISNVIGGTIADVTLSDDATFICDEAVDSFDVRVWDASDSTWGNIATQDVGDPVEDAEPVFIGPSAGTIVTLVDAAMSSIDFSARFTHATDSLTYELTGTLPTGVSFTTDTLAGTPTETGTFSGLVVTATDSNTDTAVSDTFTIRVVAEFADIRPYRGLRGKGIRNYW